jgi:hypothetical protein
MEETSAILGQCLPDSFPHPVSIQSKSQPEDPISFKEDCLLHLTDDEQWWPLYASVIRVLRLADQGSFQD